MGIVLDDTVEDYIKEVEQFNVPTLEEILSHIDQHKFPKRFEVVKNELRKRKALSENLSENKTDKGSKESSSNPEVSPERQIPGTTKKGNGCLSFFMVCGVLLVILGFLFILAAYSMADFELMLADSKPPFSPDKKARIEERKRKEIDNSLEIIAIGTLLFISSLLLKDRLSKRSSQESMGNSQDQRISMNQSVKDEGNDIGPKGFG